MAFIFRNSYLHKLKYIGTIKRANFSTVNHSIPLSSSPSFQKTDFDEKIAIVTGGGSGIGLAIVKEFLKNGISAVTVVDIDKVKTAESIQDLTKQFGEDKVLFIEADVADSKQLDYAFKHTMLHYETINIVVNNAGVMNDTTWERQIKTNLCGCVIGTLLGLQYMSKSCSGEGGTVVNIGSIMSIVPSSGCPLHTMTQFGIVGFTRAMGASNHYNRTGVKMMALCPGLTKTTLLSEAPYHTINENFSNEFREEIEGCIPQKPEEVAKGLTDIMEEAKSGSIWVIENNCRPYEVNFPEVDSMKRKSVATNA